MLIPEPKQIQNLDGTSKVFQSICLTGYREYNTEGLLKRKLWDLPGLSVGNGYEIQITSFASIPVEAPERLFRLQGYRLLVGRDKTYLQCGTREGLGHGLSTLKQLLIQKPDGYTLSLCEITDWPLIEKRSLSNCLTWYSGYGRIGFDMQLFDYEEWLEYLNVCADLKINQFNLCIYGYWPFHMPGYPESEFRDVQVQLYNAEADAFLSTTFTHPNLADEFLSKLIADAHDLGVKVYAYMGLNSYSGGYPCVHKEKRMVLPEGSSYINDFDRMCFSREENIHYMKDCIRRVVQLGFDGIDFEESEEASWFCDCDDCKKNFLKNGQTPSEAMFQASFSLFQEIYALVREENPDCVIGIRAFRQNPLIKSGEDMARIKAAIPEDVVFFWSPGLYVPKSEFLKWIDAFGPERIVGRDTESNGISACFGRLIRTFRSNGLRCDSEPLQQYIEEDVRQHREAAELMVGGSNGFMFEWYGFFLHLMVHANYPWGGQMEEGAFYRACCEHLYGEYADRVLFALQHMLTIHESQLNIFPQYLPFAAHKVESQDEPAIREAMAVTEDIIRDLSDLLDQLKKGGARRSNVNHIQKLLCANRRNAVIYRMALADLKLLIEKDPQKRTALLEELKKLNEGNFEIVKHHYFDVCPMTTTGIKSCMIPYHELKRVIGNQLHPEAADEEMIYLGVEALGWM
ncbi:glycoside hydrolase family 20 zincin-like fold domain-containing protein [Diplocloster modestus]|uniref:Glycoside hydrolase family 20 zincin-like fold domain-containing protein n=1 Tax=Diplocloster modestus TaxID=2850322 RepID=A0ABS6KCU8_9FIRM|nr:glycoside hydrolase family 20 zincin-like fold domain-containing protein [Diplocloster modestus]MBU9728321.1 glycoside hydrolase family 20 zincin-like fold domain-containing protein [Diplocloster modestus]